MHGFEKRTNFAAPQLVCFAPVTVAKHHQPAVVRESHMVVAIACDEKNAEDSKRAQRMSFISSPQ